MVIHVTARPGGSHSVVIQPNATTHPTVTVAIPTYNESSHIQNVVTTFLQTSYPRLVEILVVDGGSTDGTQAIVNHLSSIDPRVRLVANPFKDQASALNVALAEMHGDIFLRADGHSDYAADYIERCVEALLETEAINVGGVQRFVATTPFQAGVALAAHSMLGNGGSNHHNLSYDGPSDTVFLGCWWKQDLKQLDTSQLQPTAVVDTPSTQRLVASFFDRHSVPNEDADMNARLRRVKPNGIYVSSQIKAWYFPRTTWDGLRKQYFNYGRGRCRTAALHPDVSPPRAYVPLLASIGALLLGAIDRFAFRGKLRTTHLFWLASVLPFVESLRVTLTHRRYFATEIWRGPEDATPSLFQRWLYCSVSLWTMTPAYLAGYLYQLWRRRLRKIQGW